MPPSVLHSLITSVHPTGRRNQSWATPIADALSVWDGWIVLSSWVENTSLVYNTGFCEAQSLLLRVRDAKL